MKRLRAANLHYNPNREVSAKLLSVRFFFDADLLIGVAFPNLPFDQLDELFQLLNQYVIILRLKDFRKFYRMLSEQYY